MEMCSNGSMRRNLHLGALVSRTIRTGLGYRFIGQRIPRERTRKLGADIEPIHEPAARTLAAHWRARRGALETRAGGGGGGRRPAHVTAGESRVRGRRRPGADPGGVSGFRDRPVHPGAGSMERHRREGLRLAPPFQCLPAQPSHRPDLHGPHARVAGRVAAGQPPDPGRSPLRRTVERRALRYRDEVHPRHPRARRALRAPPVPVHHTSRWPLQQLLHPAMELGRHEAGGASSRSGSARTRSASVRPTSHPGAPASPSSTATSQPSRPGSGSSRKCRRGGWSRSGWYIFGWARGKKGRS